MDIEKKNLSDYARPDWLYALFDNVLESLEADFHRALLIITEDYQKAVESLGYDKGTEIGISAVLGRKLKDEEIPYIKMGINIKTDDIFLFLKPSKLKVEVLCYEELTEGFCHEISEAMVVKRGITDWMAFSRDQLMVFQSFGFQRQNLMLSQISMCVRERLADKYACEKGFAREILSVLTPRVLDSYVKGAQSTVTRKSIYPWKSVIAVGWDKSISLELAGFHELAEIFFGIWKRYCERKSKFFKAFFDYYADFREQLLATRKITSDLLLTIFNIKYIESTKTT